MVDNSPLSASDLKGILDQIALPSSLANHPLLRSWVVAEHLQEQPKAAQFSPEFLIGNALEWQLELWSQEFPLNETYHDEWLKIFCLKWYYFQKKPRLAAYQKHQTLKKLGAALVDAEVLATLVPGKETKAEALLEAEEYRTFWYSFGNEEVFEANRALEKLTAALGSFAEQIETRRAHKFSQPAQLPTVPRAIESAQHIQQVAPTASPVTASSLPSTSDSTSSRLADYQQVLDRLYPVIPGYRPPACRYDLMGTQQPVKDAADVQTFLQQHHAVLIRGKTGMGKTTYLAQVVIPACRQLALVPIFVPLPAYFDARDKAGDLSTFVREKVFGHWHPGTTEKDQFARELAEAIRDQRAIWLLDGYDELTPRERGLLNQELQHLDRFVLTTRQIRPETRRSIEATVQLANIDRSEALDYISTRYSADARSRIEAWCERQYEAPNVLTSGWWLEETAQLAHDPSQALTLTTVLDKAVTRQLSTRARFQSATSADIYALARTALGSLAFESLSPKWLSGEEPDRLNRSQLVFAWRRRSTEPESIFFEVISSTGLLLEEGEQWCFPSDLVRDELAAEFIQAEGFILSGRALYPQYERPIGFWAARLMLARQPQRVADILTALRDLNDDPYDARWSLIVRILTECLPFENSRLRAMRLETEQALLDWWRTTSSNRMKWHINMWLFALGSNQIPGMSTGVLENALRNLDTTTPEHTLPELLQQAGYMDLADRLIESSRVDQQAVTQALIDIIANGPRGLVNEAAIHLAPRNLEPTVLAKFSKDSPIDRLAELARTRPMNQYVTPQDFNRAQAAQSAALGILGRPIVLANETLLKRIPVDVIHSLMADLHLRIHKTDNRVVVITADGRDWVTRAD
ncbi:hypothetical protein TFLX_03278 [Thermoflexales bacterium]|nr:hypothetical protein TFLX_03278 [Thermoflexales bacterium]